MCTLAEFEAFSCISVIFFMLGLFLLIISPEMKPFIERMGFPYGALYGVAIAGVLAPIISVLLPMLLNCESLV